MEESDFDIYDDLDDFENDEKQQGKSADYLELREKLQDAEEEIRRLQEKNESLKAQIVNHEKVEGRLERNSSSLLITAKAEIKRKDNEIRELRKEKDNIVFRRSNKLQRNVQTRNSTTQSQITCKPFAVYELKRIDDETREKSIERSHRRDENQTTNPFASKSNNTNNNENKMNHKIRENYADKNDNHRHQIRNQDDSRGKHSNQRNRNDERREQLNVERPKRRRSRSLSKDRKRARRSRSHSRSPIRERRRNDRKRNDRISPDKGSQIQKLRTKAEIKEESKLQSPKRSTSSHELDEKRHDKRKFDDNSKQISSNRNFDAKNQPKEKEVSNKSVYIFDDNARNIKTEANIENLVCNVAQLNGDDALEEGEIDEESRDSMKRDAKECIAVEQKPNSQFKSEIYADIKPEMPATKNNEIKNEVTAEKSIKTEANPESQPASIPEIEAKSDNLLHSSDEIDTESTTAPVKTENNDVVEHLKEEIVLIPKTEDIQMKAVENTDTKPIENTSVHAEELTDNKTQNTEQNDENSVPNLQDRVEDVENTIKSDEVLPMNNENASIPTCSPSKNCTNLNEHEQSNKQSETNSNGESFTDVPYNELLNSSGNKSVKNISTSSKDYLIVENDNDEMTIYVTRKKKKKKKKKKESLTNV